MFLSLLMWLRNIFIIAIIIISSLSFYAIKIEPNWFEIVPVSIKIPELSASFEGFKIVQISDLHADDSMNPKKLRKIIKLVEEQKPDLVAITGDFFSRQPNEQAKRLLETNLSNLWATAKTVAVLGNHDYYYNPTIIRDILKQSNVLELGNSVYTIQRGTEKLNIAGVDDYWKRKSRLDLVIEQLPSEGVAILLAHEPDFADISSASNRFALQISGHSHGGQVRIPFRRPPVLPSLGRKYPLGRYQVGNMVQYTNRGVGMGKPLIRFAARPEITVFTLSSADVV